MEILSGAIAAVAFMVSSGYVGATLDEQPRACDFQVVTVQRPGDSYSFETTICDQQAHPEWVIIEK